MTATDAVVAVVVHHKARVCVVFVNVNCVYLSSCVSDAGSRSNLISRFCEHTETETETIGLDFAGCDVL